MDKNKILGTIEQVTFDWKWYTSRSENKSNSSGRDGNQLRYAKLQTSAKEYTLWGFPSLKGVRAHIADNEEMDIIAKFKEVFKFHTNKDFEYTFWVGKYDKTDYLSHATGFYACTMDDEHSNIRNTIVFIRDDVELYQTDAADKRTLIDFKKSKFEELFTCLK